MENRFFAPAYMRLLYRFLHLSPEQEHRLFQGTSVGADDLLAAEPTINFAIQMQICRNALTLSHPGLGLRMGRQLQLATHGALGIAMQNANSLDQALAVYAEFGATRASFFDIGRTSHRSRHTLALSFHDLPEDLIPFFSESILATIDHCLTFYASSEGMASRIDLAYPAPSYADQYQSALNAPVRFDAPQTLVEIPASVLDTSTYDSDANLFADAIRRCRMEIGSQQSHSATMAIEQFLRNNLGTLWTVDEIADFLDMSKRTLLRTLRSEQTSYRAIRDRILQEHAALYLRSMTVATVTTLLGFADESSFRRSFKRWYGVTPSEYRQRFIGQGRL